MSPLRRLPNSVQLCESLRHSFCASISYKGEYATTQALFRVTSQPFTLRDAFTPTHAIWLNQTEIWFGILTRKVVRRGIFKPRQELVDRLLNFIEAYNQDARPFEWTYNLNPLAA
ncbi:MAG: hypothetical protein ACLQVG_14850 [Terriglobia bacterium]